MQRQKKAAVTSSGKGRTTTADSQLSSPNCTSIHNDLSSPPDYLAQMRQAAADYLSAFASFLDEIEVSNG